ncbi:MAG: elongation factor G [Ruminococcaceae bacterium]|nr:elongation factor G [Oscillospiraceae bacterium]
MKDYTTEAIRNIALVAHGGTGKTNLAEAMLYNAKLIDRQGKVSDGNTVMDFDQEEIKRKISINTSLASFEWNDCKINIIDTPGYFDFVGEMIEGTSVADGVVIMVSGKSGVQVGTEKAWAVAEKNNIPKIIFVNEIDEEEVDFTSVVNQLKDAFGKSIAPLYIPIRENGKVIGFYDVIHGEARKYVTGGNEPMALPSEYEGEVKENTDMLAEAVAETSEELMDKYFNGEEFTKKEILSAVKKGIEECSMVPVLFGSALKNIGIKALVDAICEYFPAPNEIKQRNAYKPGTDEIIEVNTDSNGPVSIFVFKTLIDPYVGKLSYFKVMSGTLKADSTLKNIRKGEDERISRLFTMCGKKQIEVKTLSAGDIGAVNKLAITKTGDTLSDPKNQVEFEKLIFPKPALSLAVLPKEKGDEEKISSGLSKLRNEDPSFNFYNNTETHQLIISGMGEQHIDVIISKLKTRYGAEVTLAEPKVPYRETIKKKVTAEGKHKKQSGGHGQYGHVKIEFEPGMSEGLEFAEQIFGGSVPKNYFPAVEKGLLESIEHGVLAGYPVVNLKATLLDGSYHPVDSSEMAFKMAAHIAYKNGLEQANPVLLEPIGKLVVIVPDQYMGDIMGDVNKRRGRILGMNPIGNGLQEVTAEVPMAEMHKYAIDLRSMTQARGSFEFDFERYEEAPNMVAEKIIAESKK